jgi:SLT domain-containing protein
MKDLKHIKRFNESEENLNISDNSGSFNRFEEFFRNQRDDVYYEGVKMDKKEVLDLVKEFFKTVKENDEGMWKDGIDGSAVWSRFKD